MVFTFFLSIYNTFKFPPLRKVKLFHKTKRYVSYKQSPQDHNIFINYKSQSRSNVQRYSLYSLLYSFILQSLSRTDIVKILAHQAVYVLNAILDLSPIILVKNNQDVTSQKVLEVVF